MHLTMQTNTGTNGFSGVNPNSTTPRSSRCRSTT